MSGSGCKLKGWHAVQVKNLKETSSKDLNKEEEMKLL